MGLFDWIVLGLIAVLVVLAVIFMWKRRGQGCSGNCGACGSCAMCHRPEKNIKE